MKKERDYWLPQYKYQFVEWLSNLYPAVPLTKWEKMSKNRLMAIYCAIRNKRG